jgi:hypothetical protein
MAAAIVIAFALSHACVWQYLKDMVARHIREAKAAAEAKIAAARAAKLRAKLAAAAQEALARCILRGLGF